MASAFLMPALLGCFWRRATAAGAIAAMVAGAAVTLGLYLLGSLGPDAARPRPALRPRTPTSARAGLRPYYLLGFDPCVWGLAASLARRGRRQPALPAPDPARVALLFDAQPPTRRPPPATLEIHPRDERPMSDCRTVSNLPTCLIAIPGECLPSPESSRTAMSTIRVAAVQMEPKLGEVAANRAGDPREARARPPRPGRGWSSSPSAP